MPYDNPDGPGFIYIGDRDSSLPTAPAIDEGEVLEVDFEYSNNTAAPESWVRCQVCPKTVRRRDPHPVARVLRTTTVHETFARLHYCSRECWVEWASST